MEFLMLPLIALIGIVVLHFTKEKEIIRVSWDKLAQFMAFLAFLFVIRLLWYQFEYDAGIMQRFPMLPPEIAGQKWTFALVFWEDFFFGIPLYFIWKYMSRKWLQISLTVIISVLFGLGHAYQGWYGVAITSLLPYFICYRYGKKYGFGTTMIGHIMYDVSTAYLIVLLPYLLR